MFSIEDIRAFRKRGKSKLILDTNLLHLLLVGACNESYITECQLTRKYRVDDFNLLKEILKYFDGGIIITPHILTELSNQSIGSISERKLQFYMQKMISHLKTSREESVNLSELLTVKLALIMRFGFPDMGIIGVAKRTDAVILTDDLPMYNYAISLRIPSIKYSHVKERELIKL